MLLPLAEIPVNGIASNQPSRATRRRPTGPPLRPHNYNIAPSCAGPERHDSLIAPEYNSTFSEEDEQLVFSHHSHLRSTIRDAEEAVTAEMNGHAYGDIQELIDCFLGDDAALINKITERIYRALVKSKAYNVKEKNWKELPRSPSTEKVLYTPLTAVLNKILQLCPEAKYEVNWRDEHASPPKSDFQDQSRPDLINATRAALLWWRAIHSLIEIKKDEDDPAALQLLRYIRSTLREQPDRRFMYGLVFARRSLTLWHVDRSGSLAAPPFDIHNNPKQFIRIIVGLLVKSPESLGWDPTMLRFVVDEEHPNGHALPSYSVKDAHSASSAYARMWITTVDAPSSATGSSHEASTDGETDRTSTDIPQEHFVLYAALSLARAEVLRGRATRIWLAWKYGDMGKDQKDRKVYVFKDSWRDERRGLEGDFYREGLGVAKVYSHSVVRINGRRDDTLNFIRRGVKPFETHALSVSTKQRDARRSLESNPVIVDQYLFPSIMHGKPSEPLEGDILEKVTSQGGPYNRLHTRLIMETYGVPLTRFRSLIEVVGTLNDSIQGHEFLCSQNILHRDVSQGNIVIIPEPHTQRGFRGVLIDLDFAVEMNTERRATIGDERSGTRAFMSGELLLGKPYKFPKSKPLSGFMLPAATAIPKSKSVPQAVAVKHDIVHDIESFFWVLCWLCVSYEGPSTRRTQAWDKDANVTAELKEAIRYTFESTDPRVLASHKAALLVHSDPDDSDLEQWCTPYFRPLLPLITALHATLKGAYSTRTFTELHTKFRGQLAFAETIEEVPTWNDTDTKYRSQEEAEMATRRRERDGPIEDNNPPKVWKSREEIQRDVEVRSKEFVRRGNTTPVKRAGPSSSGSGLKRTVRFDGDDSAEDASAASSSSLPRITSKRRWEADDDVVEGDGAHASSSATGEASTSFRHSTRSKTKAAQDGRTATTSGSRPAKATKPRSKKRARK